MPIYHLKCTECEWEDEDAYLNFSELDNHKCPDCDNPSRVVICAVAGKVSANKGELKRVEMFVTDPETGKKTSYNVTNKAGG